MHGPVTVSGGNDGPPHDGDIAIGVVVISIATEVEVGVTVMIVIATKTVITVAVDIDSTTEERFANGGLSVPVGGLGGGVGCGVTCCPDVARVNGAVGL